MSANVDLRRWRFVATPRLCHETASEAAVAYVLPVAVIYQLSGGARLGRSR